MRIIFSSLQNSQKLTIRFWKWRFNHIVYVEYFTRAIIELIKVYTFLIYKSTLTLKFDATWKIQHYYTWLVNTKCVHTHKIVEVFNFPVLTRPQIKGSVKHSMYIYKVIILTAEHSQAYTTTCSNVDDLSFLPSSKQFPVRDDGPCYPIRDQRHPWWYQALSANWQCKGCFKFLVVFCIGKAGKRWCMHCVSIKLYWLFFMHVQIRSISCLLFVHVVF